MIVVLEFFRQSPGDQRRVIVATEERNFETAKVAVLYPLGGINNVIFNGKRADGCLIKNKKGVLICEVRSDARQTGVTPLMHRSGAVTTALIAAGKNLRLAKRRATLAGKQRFCEKTRADAEPSPPLDKPTRLQMTLGKRSLFHP